MRAPHIARRHPGLRWLVPVTVLGFAVASTFLVLRISTERTHLPATTPEKLISAVQGARSGGFSGTLLAQMKLDLPVSADTAGVGAPLEMQAGTHTMRFWYGDDERQRVALLNPTSENDVFQVGTDIWQWDSATRVAVHSRLPAVAQAGIGSPISPAPLTIAAITPEELTERTLDAVDDQTTISVHDGREIADRPTYELVLEPSSDSGTRIASVHIAIDATAKVPLGVQVYARGMSEPSIDVSFSNVTFKNPAAEYFVFAPPSGATVVRGAQPQLLGTDGDVAASAGPFGSSQIGWSSITAYRTSDGRPAATSAPVKAAMTAVSGKWGTGSLLETPLLCMLVSNDGRVFSGSVEPSALYAAAESAP